MPRRNRTILSRQLGHNHIYSRIAGGECLLGTAEKEYLLNLITRFSSGFFVTIHSFAIMSNHFHILITEGTEDALRATKDDLMARYRSIFGKNADPPWGTQDKYGKTIPDPDEGIERLRKRLGSVSRFIQEVKQTFSHWYNVRHNRKGYLWGDRFGSQQVEKGDAGLVCSAYIDLNPVRAGMVDTPDHFRWCSVGLKVRAPARARKMLCPLPDHQGESLISDEGYRLLVYRYGMVPVSGKASIDPSIVSKVESLCGRIGIEDLVKSRIRNMTEGIALGSQDFIASIQKSLGRKMIKPRCIQKQTKLFATRVLASP